MTTLTLACSTNDLILDASQSSVAINALHNITLTPSGKFVVTGATQFTSLVSGFLQADSSGNISAATGSLFNPGSPVALTSTLSVSGAATFSAAILNTGIATQASTLAIPSLMPPTGWSYVVCNNSTGEFRRLT